MRDTQGDTAPQDFGQELVLTKGEILNLILSGEQQEYQKNLIYHGYTEEVQSKLRAIIGSELLEFGHTMRTLLMNSGVAEVYAERTGHHLPDNPNYWPIHIDHITHTKGEASPDENKFRAAPTDSFLRRRVVSMGAIKPMDAMLVFQSNIAGRHNYIYMQPIVDTWNSLMANPHFTHRLEGTIGSERLKKLRTGLDLLVNAAWGDTQLHGAFAKFCSFVQSGRAISLLSGNLGTLVRQLTALNWRYDAALWSNGKAMNDAGVQKSGKKMTNEKVVNHATKKREKTCSLLPSVSTGDGNRTRVSCLGSTRPTIERRPRVTRGIISLCPILSSGKRNYDTEPNFLFLV